MDIKLMTRDVTGFRGDALVVGVTQVLQELQGTAGTLDGPAATLDHVLGGLIRQLQRSGEFTGKAGETSLIHTLGKLETPRLLLVGLGPRDQMNTNRVRRGAAIACRSLGHADIAQVGLALFWPELGLDAAATVQAMVEGALFGLYQFNRYKSVDNEKGTHRINTLTLFVGPDGDTEALQSAIERGRIMAEATNFARDLANEPPNVLTPTELANRARAMAQAYGLECEILDRAQMEERGMGALLGVARGSAQPPKFIILRYRGGDPRQPGMALVGKGITFDTGGISIKPADRMEEMKFDMCGAAAVIGAMMAIAQLKPPINVTALAPATENMPGGNAYHPGDILRTANGKTIEIVNTDAEGRLILSDALSLARKEGLAPIIDVATLTGACVVALGKVHTGVFSNDQSLIDEIIAAGSEEGEKFWPMPMDEEYDELIKSEVADVKQTGGRYAGAITAAKVLSHFAQGAPWAHLDIAGTAYDEKKPYQAPGATGVAVRTLARLAERLAR
jgi:leucyl aminopeptidase